MKVCLPPYRRALSAAAFLGVGILVGRYWLSDSPVTQSEKGRRDRGVAKFLSNTPAEPLGERVELLEAKVEAARDAWLDFAKKHRIVDSVLVDAPSDGNDDPLKFQH